MPEPRPALPPETTGPAHERVYRSLRARIMQGDLAPGAALTLRGIAAALGVSMTPVREAVRRLAAEGALGISATGRIATAAPGPERLEELAQIRALLEPELAARALPRAHPALIERLAAINRTLDAIIAAGDATGYVRVNQEFHRTLYLRAQAPAMLALTESVWLQTGPAMRALYAAGGQFRPTVLHRKIIAALREGDEPGLRLAVRADVTQSLRMLTP
jgi:DNA-binding GntR family transcriptional regulator